MYIVSISNDNIHIIINKCGVLFNHNYGFENHKSLSYDDILTELHAHTNIELAAFIHVIT